MGQIIKTGSSYNSFDGDPLRTAFIKTRTNFEAWDSTFPSSYLFPYTGSARLDGNLDIKGQISFSAIGGEEITLPIDTSTTVNYDVSSSTELVNLNSSSIFDGVFIPYNLGGNGGLTVSSSRIHYLYPSQNSTTHRDIIEFQAQDLSFVSNKTRTLNIGTADAYDVAEFGRTIARPNRRIIFPKSIPSNSTFKISAKNNPNLLVAGPSNSRLGINNLPVADGAFYTQVNGSLFISASSPVTFNWRFNDGFIGLDKEDPENEGELFFTSSEHLGLTPGSYVVCVSQG